MNRRKLSPAPTVRVTTFELFFDLVFVLTITRLTEVLRHEPEVVGLLMMFLVLANVWWMYAAFCWVTSKYGHIVPGNPAAAAHRHGRISCHGDRDPARVPRRIWLLSAAAACGASVWVGTAVLGLAQLALVIVILFALVLADPLRREISFRFRPAARA